LRDAPAEVERTLIGDGFLGDEEDYRAWCATKTGAEFIVMIPDEYDFDDMLWVL